MRTAEEIQSEIDKLNEELNNLNNELELKDKDIIKEARRRCKECDLPPFEKLTEFTIDVVFKEKGDIFNDITTTIKSIKINSPELSKWSKTELIKTLRLEPTSFESKESISYRKRIKVKRDIILQYIWDNAKRYYDTIEAVFGINLDLY